MRLLSVCALLVLAACPLQSSADPAATVPAGAYTLDRAHASLVFRVNHLGFSNFTGRFTRFEANLQFDPVKPAASRVTVTIDPRSIEADNAPEGFLDMLRGEQWLNAAQFPQMTFRSTKVEHSGADTLHIYGDFTLHGVTRPLILEATFNGGYAGHPLDPQARIGFSASGSFNRSDFGIDYGLPAPGTTMGVGDNVDVIIEAEFSGPPLVAGIARPTVSEL